MTKQLALLYNVAGSRRKQIEMLAAILNIKTKTVAPSEYGVGVGALCGLEEYEDAPQGLWNDFDEEMMVMAFFPQPLIQRFLDAFRQTGVPSVRLKAVLTGVNSRWNSCQLRAELLREEAAFRARDGRPSQ